MMSDEKDLLTKIELVNSRAKSLLAMFQISKLKDVGYTFSLARHDPTYGNMLCKDNTILINLPRVNDLIRVRYLCTVALNTESSLGSSVQVYSENLIYDIKTILGDDTFKFICAKSNTGYKEVVCHTDTNVMIEFSKISGIDL